MAKHFLGVWLIYWIVILLLPVHSIYPATAEAFGLQCAFVALVLISYTLTFLILGKKSLPMADGFELPTAPMLVRVALGMSVIGVFFLIYDKIYIQGIDYTEGIVAAREEWRRLGEERDGAASSIFSMVGYLLGSGYYVAAVLAVTQVTVLTSRQRVGAILASFILLMVNSAITGGRSNVLLLAVFLSGAMVAKNGLMLKKLFQNQMQRWLLVFTTGLAGAYTLFVFYQRAYASEMTAQHYALEFLPDLGLEIDDWFGHLLNEDVFSSFAAILILAVSYMTHSFSTVAAIIDAPPEDKTLIFLHLSGILSKIGLINAPDGSWFLAGRFPSVPGALWFQFGWFGFTAGGLLIGIMSAVAKTWIALQPARLLPLGVFVMVYSFLLLTPLLAAVDFLSFPFVAAAFVLLSFIDRYFLLRKNKMIFFFDKKFLG